MLDFQHSRMGCLSMIDFYRTDDIKFEGLPEYPFAPHFIPVSAENSELRMHYIDTGPGNSIPVLLLHGQPSWSYLYRKMISPLAEAGYRVIAPDLIGFGKSDKPLAETNYSYSRHEQWLLSLIEQLNLNHIHLFCQDWGGMLGLRIAAFNDQRFQSIIVSNTGLAPGGQKMPEEWIQFRDFCEKARKLPISRLIQSGCQTRLSSEIKAAYDAPFPEEASKAAARIFPRLIPLHADDPEAQRNQLAWKQLQKWNKPFLTAFSDSDPITARGEIPFLRMIPEAKRITVKGGGHFIQEDCSDQLVSIMLDFYNDGLLSD